MIGKRRELEALEQYLDHGADGRALILLATGRRWLRSALEEVLAPEGFSMVFAGDAEQLEQRAQDENPALVIVDEELPGLEVESAARLLVSGPLGSDTPLLLYTSTSAARVREHVRALEAGFWELLTDPLRPAQLIARLRRMLALSGRMRDAGKALGESDDSTRPPIDFLSLQELGRILPAMGALAEREGTSLSIVLLAPSSQMENDGGSRRLVAESVCGGNVRRADLCALIDGAEVAIVAFDTSANEAKSLVKRLDALVSGGAEAGDGGPRLSAAIVELKPSTELERAVRRAGRQGKGGSVSLERVVELFHLQDAKSALSDARESGGGVRIVEVA